MMKIIFLIFCSFCFISLSECIATYSIDLSSEFIKIAIVKPGVPMEIALNGESQRKTPAVVFIKGEERLFGDPAISMGVKYPKHLYHSIITLVGKTIGHSVVQDFIKNFPYFHLIMNENNQLSFRDGKSTYTVEELLAMILENARNIAETYAETPMKGSLLVVPPFFTQDERHAVLRSAEMGGINVLQLMNSNTAVGLNYGIFRRKTFNSTVQYYMFYDVGSSATVASIIGYQVVKSKEYGMVVENPQLSVVGIGFDRTLGGTQFTLRLQKHLAMAFNAAKKTKTDVTTVPRSMAKLYKEANRVVRVLSANSEIYAQIENVLDDKDFKLKITRTQFEEMCSDLFARFSETIHRALESAQIPMPVIKEIILMGGGTRMPRVQEILLKTSGRQELGKGINTDEAAALGAVYQAAFISPGFKVQNFLVKDCNLVPITINFMKSKIKENKEIAQPTSRMLFDLMNSFPLNKVLTFNKHFSNFDFNVTQGNGDSETRILMHVSVDNLTDVYNEYTKPSDSFTTESKGVKAHFGIDNSGLFVIKYIEAIFERKRGKITEEPEPEINTFEKIGNTISNFFGSSSEKKESDVVTDDKEPITKNEDSKKTFGDNVKNESKSGNDTTKNGNDTGTNNVESEKPKSKTEVVNQNLRYVVTLKSFDIPSNKILEASLKKIAKMKAIDDQKIALEKAKNELESYIFDLRGKFDKQEYKDCSTEAERSAVLDSVRVAGDWYEEQGPGTGREEYTSRLEGLRRIMHDIDLRVFEVRTRPEMVSKLVQMLNTSHMFLDNLYNVSGDGPGMMFTKAEYNALGRLVNDTTKWFEKTNKTIKSMRLDQNPNVRAADFEPKLVALERELAYLINKISIWRNQATSPPTTAPEEKGEPLKSERKTDKTAPVSEEAAQTSPRGEL